MSHDDPSRPPAGEPPAGQGPGGDRSDLSEEELRARFDEELRRITVRDVLLQTVVSLVNLAGQRLGLAEGAQDMRDLGQVRTAIEAVRALLPLVEEEDPDQLKPVRDALAQLQMVYAREVGAGGAPPAGEAPERPPAGEPPPAPRRPGGPGGLWVPPGSST
jgi:hypothetical protein